MGSSVKPEPAAPAGLSLSRVLTPDEFHQAQLLPPATLAQPGVFPTLPPIPKGMSPYGVAGILPPGHGPSMRAQSDATRTPQAQGMPQSSIGAASTDLAQPTIGAGPNDGIPQHSAAFNTVWAVANYGDAMTRAFIDDVIHKPARAAVNLVPESAIINAGIQGIKQSATTGDTRGAVLGTALAMAPFAVPMSAEGAGYLRKVAGAWREAFQGSTEGDLARGILRSQTGSAAARYEQAAFKLDEFRRILDPLPDEHKYALIHAIESGEWREAVEPSPIVQQANAPITPHRLKMAQINGAMSARGGDAPSNNPYLPESPLHAEWKRGFEGVPQEDIGAENVLQQHAQGMSPEDAKQINADLEEEKQIADVQRRNELTLKTMRSALGDQSIEAPKIPFAEFDRRAINSMQGQKPLTIDPAWKPFIETIRSTLDGAREQIQALGTGKLDHFIEDYFPHIWEDPERAADVFRQIGSRGPMEGPASFLKQRTIPTVKEGLEQGLVPVSKNPVDLVLLKYREMNRYLMAHQAMNELAENNLTKFVRAGDLPPDGYKPINDKIATVFGPRQGAVKLPEGATRPGEAPEAPKVSPRDENGKLRRNLSAVSTEDLGAEWQRLAELNGNEEGEYRGMESQGYRAAYHDLPATEKLGAKGQEDLPDADGEVDPEQLLRDNKIGKNYNRNQIIRAAREKAMQRIEAEMNSRPDATDFNFGANERRAKVEAGIPLKPEDVQVFGKRIMGAYYAPEQVAGVVNNYLSPGLSTQLQQMLPGPAGRAAAMTFDAYRGLGNTLNQAQLGLSAFHLGMTSLDATVSRNSLALEYLAAGKPGKALRYALTSPVAALPGIISGLSHTAGEMFDSDALRNVNVGLGAKIRAAYLNPEAASPQMRELAQAVQEAGGRVRQDSYYQTSAIKNTIDSWKAGDYGRSAFKALGVPFELAAKPLMEHIVPLQKLQVFGEMAQKGLSELEPDATLADRREVLQRAWDSTDNRMGQLVYDNLFWNKAIKDMAMASVRSVGWNLGTIRELGGGLLDAAAAPVKIAKGAPVGGAADAALTHRAAYALALPMTVGLYGAAYQLLRTGQGPQELKDYFYPKTGELDADGNPERVQLPSYMKDMMAYAGSPVQTLTHKVAPVPSALHEMLSNQDFYGDEIRNPHDPLVKQLQQEAEYIGKTAVPFGIRNYMESSQRGDQSAVTKIGNFFGITPAPRTRVRGPGQNLMAEYQAEDRTVGATPEEADARRERATILSGLRGNKGVDLEKSVNDALASGNLTPPQLARLMKRAGLTPAQERFKAMPLNKAMEIFRVSDPHEQGLFAELLAKKIERSMK